MIPIIKEARSVFFGYKDLLFEVVDIPVEDIATVKGCLSAQFKREMDHILSTNQKYPSRIVFPFRDHFLVRKTQGLFTYGDYLKFRYVSR